MTVHRRAPSPRRGLECARLRGRGTSTEGASNSSMRHVDEGDFNNHLQQAGDGVLTSIRWRLQDGHLQQHASDPKIHGGSRAYEAISSQHPSRTKRPWASRGAEPSRRRSCRRGRVNRKLGCSISPRMVASPTRSTYALKEIPLQERRRSAPIISLAEGGGR